MKLKKLYEEVVKKGIEADPRGKSEIDRLLKEKKKQFEKLSDKEKAYFDRDTLSNPFADTRILFGKDETSVASVMVGIDMEGAELLLADRLNQKKKQVDLVLAHHPEGKAYAHFYEVMDVQGDIFVQKGVSVACAENLVCERKAQVERRVSAANHQRNVDIARLLNIPYMCVHTPADNLAYQFVVARMKKEKPRTIEAVMDVLMAVPEYKDAALHNNPPKIIAGNKKAKVSKIHVEFTGGTEGPKDIYQKLSAAGIDTIIAMHQSEEHFKKSKEAHINVIVASHIASDNIGMNIMLDHLSAKGKLTLYECSGFKRVARKK